MINSLSRNKTSLFTLIVLCATLIITIFVVLNPTNINPKASGKKDAAYNFELIPTYTFMSVPHDPKISAKQLCQEVPGIIKIGKFVNPNWQTFNCVNSNNPENFQLLPHHGYVIKVENPTHWLSTGKEEAPKYRFEVDLNFWGVSPSQTGYTDAQSLCDKSPDPKYKVTQIYRWYNNTWDSHLCLYQTNNFDLKEGEGYLIRTEKLDKSQLQNNKVDKSPSLPR